MVIFAFWLAAMLLCLAALALILPPLLRRRSDPRRDIERELAGLKRRHEAGEVPADEYARERDALSRRLLAAIETAGPPPATALAVMLAIALPVAALALYFTIGQPRALDPALQRAGSGEGMPRGLDEAIAALEQRLRQHPDDINGWLLLARSYRSLERFEDMLRATSSAFALAPQSPDVMAEHAEAMTLAAPGRRFGDEARRLLGNALAVQPDHQKALWLLGVAEIQADRAPEAVRYWRRLRALIPDDDPVAASLDQQIARALAMAADAPAPGPDSMPATGQPGTDDPTTGPEVHVRIELDDALRARLPANGTLFVFARDPAGGPPLAIRRIENPEFPIEVTLGTGDSMIPSMRLQAGSTVNVGARLSASGQAQAQAGDIEASPQPVRLDNSTPAVALALSNLIE